MRTTALCVLLATHSVTGDFDPHRVHLVDQVGENYLFRGPIPIANHTFALNQVKRFNFKKKIFVLVSSDTAYVCANRHDDPERVLLMELRMSCAHRIQHGCALMLHTKAPKAIPLYGYIIFWGVYFIYTVLQHSRRWDAQCLCKWCQRSVDRMWCWVAVRIIERRCWSYT